MKIYTRDELREAYQMLSQEDRPINRVVNARRDNTANEYDSDTLLSNSKRLANKRAKNSLSVMAKFAGKPV